MPTRDDASPAAADRRRTSSAVRPHTTVTAVDWTSGARPIESHAARTRPYIAATSDAGRNGTLISSANRAARAGRPPGPLPPTMTGGRGDCTGLGSAGESATV